MNINNMIFLIFEEKKIPYWKTALHGGMIGAGIGAAGGAAKQQWKKTVTTPNDGDISVSQLKKKYPTEYKNLKPEINKARLKSMAFYGAAGSLGSAGAAVAKRKISEMIKKRKEKKSQ
jgi:hypothetical protein